MADLSKTLEEAAKVNSDAANFLSDLRASDVLVTEGEVFSHKLNRRMKWVEATLSDRANAAAEGVVFEDPEITAGNAPKTLEQWILMSAPTGEKIDGGAQSPEADEPQALSR